MKFILVIACITFFVQSCSKQFVTSAKDTQQSSNDSLSNLVTGKWNWVQSDGGISYRVENPSNTGNNLQLQFNTDGTANYYKNGALQYTGNFVLAVVVDPANGDTSLTISQNYFGMYAEAEVEAFHITSDTIIFDEPGADRFRHIYTRYVSQVK